MDGGWWLVGWLGGIGNTGMCGGCCGLWIIRHPLFVRVLSFFSTRLFRRCEERTIIYNFFYIDIDENSTIEIEMR